MGKELDNLLRRYSVTEEELRRSGTCEFTPMEEFIGPFLRYTVHKPSKTIELPLSQIEGCSESHDTDNYLDFFRVLFDEKQDGYGSRSLGMLKFGINDVMEDMLNGPFQKEAMVTDCIDGHYFVSDNGKHRLAILKLFSAIEECWGVSEEQLDKKYVIPVRNFNVDLIKTYSNYISTRLGDERFFVKNEYVDHAPTGNGTIVYHGENYSADDRKLLTFLQNRVEKVRVQKPDTYAKLVEDLGKVTESGNYESFSTFLDLALPNVSSDIKETDSSYGETGIRR